MDPVIYFFADWLVGLLFLADADKFIIYFVAVWAIVCFWLILESFIIFFFAVWCGFSPYFHRSSPPRAFFWRSLGRRGAVPGRWTHPRGSAWRPTATLSSSTLATPEFRFSEEDGGSALRDIVLNYPYKTISCFFKNPLSPSPLRRVKYGACVFPQRHFVTCQPCSLNVVRGICANLLFSFALPTTAQ